MRILDSLFIIGGFAVIAFAGRLAGLRYLGLEAEIAHGLGALIWLTQFVIFSLYRQRSDRLFLAHNLGLLGEEREEVSDKLEIQRTKSGGGSLSSGGSGRNRQELVAEIKVLQTLLGQVAAAKRTPSAIAENPPQKKSKKKTLLQPIKNKLSASPVCQRSDESHSRPQAANLILPL